MVELATDGYGDGGGDGSSGDGESTSKSNDCGNDIGGGDGERDGSGERWWRPSRKRVSGEDNFGSIVGFVGLIFESYPKYVAGRRIANFVA